MKTFDNVVVLDDKKILFYPITKVANRAIRLGLAGVNSNDIFNLHKTISREESLNYADYYKFAVIRDPVDRLVSCYQDKVVDGKCELPFFRYYFYPDMSFSEFVKKLYNILEGDCPRPQDNIDPSLDEHIIPQYKFITYNKTLLTDDIFKLHELGQIEKKLNIKIPKTWSSTKCAFPTKEDRKLIREIYRYDSLLNSVRAPFSL